jgi:hypothetical protein
VPAVLHLVFAASETSSKTAFYIAGAVVAVWAVILAGIGLSRPDFPYNGSGQRGVIGISFVLVVIAIGAAILTS